MDITKHYEIEKAENTQLLDTVTITKAEAVACSETEILDRVLVELVKKSNALGLAGKEVTAVVSCNEFTSDYLAIELHGIG